MFATLVDTGVDPDNLAKAWKALLAAAGLRDQHFHDLRHAAATMMPHDGMGVVEVSAVLGHAQTSTTLIVYAHALPGGEPAGGRPHGTAARLASGTPLAQ